MRREATSRLESGRAETAGLSSEDGRDPADHAERASEADARLQLASQDFELVRLVDEAIAKIDRGTYGVCEVTGDHIPEGRLEALPFARCTVKAQAALERSSRRPFAPSISGDEEAAPQEPEDDE